MADPATPEEFFDGNPLGVQVFERVESLLGGVGPFDVRVSRSQISFRCRRGFAHLWSPQRWIAHPDAVVVLSIAMGHHEDSGRFKEVVHPANGVWMHHLEVLGVDEIDDEVAGWLRAAYEERG